MADDKTTKTPEQPVTDTGPGKETPPTPPKEPEKVSVSPEPEKKTEPEVKNPQVSVYNFAEIMKEKKVEERAAAPGVEKPDPAKAEKPEKQPEAPKKAEEKPKEPEQPKRRGRPPKANKDKDAAPKSKAPAQKPEKAVKKEPEKKTAPTIQAAPAPKGPEKPKDAPRRGKEQIVYIKLNELHAFKNHPFEVRDDEEMRAMVSSVKDKGVTQPAIVRPREDGGYEIVSGHRRQKASELAGYADMPCIVRNLTDDEAITQMVEDNLNQREEILPSERAKALKMQLEAIKHQGSRTSGQIDPKDAGKRSNEIVAERNKMAVKQVQRYIRLNELVPDLMKLMDEKKLGFTTAVELSYIGKKNQNYIAVAIDSQQSSPSQAQAKRIVNNLIQNVIAHSHADKIKIALSKKENNMELLLADNGVGIEKEDLKHIFERLYKCDKGRSEKGSGLGLSIVHQLVEKMGGSITVESLPGKGTEFMLLFPLES